MYRTALLGILAVMLGTSAAMAGEKEDLKFKCHFSGDDKGATECRAWIKVEGKGPQVENEREETRARLRVECNGVEIFDGRADADFKRDELIVEPKHGDLPRIVITDDNHGTRNERDNNRFDATLEFDKGEIEGTCRLFDKRDMF